METTQLTDPSGYDVSALVQWYIDLRNHKSALKRSIEPALTHTDNQMELIERELNKRIVESGVKSMKTDKGTISRVQKTKYLLTDSFAFRQWLVKNPEIGAQLISGITQGEVRAYIEEGNELPSGVSVDNYFDLSVRRT